MRVVVGEVVELGVARQRVVEAHQAFLDRRPGYAQVGAIWPDSDSARVGSDGRRQILEERLDPRQHHWPAEIARRIRRGFDEVAAQTLASVVRRGEEGGFTHEVVVLRVGLEDLDVLVHGRRIILLPRQDRDQAAPQLGDARGRAAQGLDLLFVEGAQAAIVPLAGVNVGHGGNRFGVERFLGEQSAGELAGTGEVSRFGGLVGRLQRETPAQRSVRDARGALQCVDRLRGHLVAPVEIDRRADHAEDGRILTIQLFHRTLGRGDVRFALVEPHQVQPRPHAFHGVGCDGDFALLNFLDDRLEAARGGIATNGGEQIE